MRHLIDGRSGLHCGGAEPASRASNVAAPVRPWIPSYEGATDMRHSLARVLAAAAVLSLAAYGGGGDSGSQPSLGLDDIRDLTGPSAPE